MRHYITTILLFLTSIIPTTKAFADDVPSMVYGYCGDIAHSIGMYGRNVAYQGGMCIDEETMTGYAGCRLTAVMIGTGTEAWKEAKLNLSYDLNEAPFYQQDIEVQTHQWNTIELTTPYTLEAGKTLYIYYTLKAGQNARERWCPLATDDGPANSKGDLWGYAATPEELKWMHLADEQYGNICIKAILEGLSLTRYDLTIDNITTRDFVRPGVPFATEVSVRNIASETIRTLDLTYQIGDSQPVTKTFSTYLENNRTDFFTLDGMVIDTDGDYTITVTVSHPNGAEDEYKDNDSRTATIRCSSKLVSRKVLLELFSTSACANCPAAHERLEEGLGGDGNIIWVSHHAGFGTDAYTLQQSSTYLSLYNSPSTYAPAMMLDRTCLFSEGASDNGTPVTAIGDATLLRHLADVRLNEPSTVSVDVEAHVNTAEGKIEATISGESLVDLAGARLNIYLTEDGIVGKQRGAANEMQYTHNHVLRDVLTSTWGNSFELNDGKFAETFSTFIKDEWNLSHMNVVAFVSHMNFSDPCDCTIYNAATKPLLSGSDAITDIIRDGRGAQSTYNLAGQRVDEHSLSHGSIIIRNGKKLLIK